uniref:Golgin B1 n=1 Tax=Otolemur garnettii TaxID=30611 RepID=H0XV95_OTOGA
MLSRLSGLANVVLHELSGDDTDENMRTPLDPELPQESDMEFNKETQEDVLERLAYAEKLVVELKDIIRQKDVQLQQKEEVLQEERKAADNKIKKLKLHAKAKLTSLNKHIEEMKAQGGTVLPTESKSEEQLSKHDKSSVEENMEMEMMKHKLQEKEELINTLQAQLTQAQAEPAAQSNIEMEEFIIMKQQLQEQEKLISTLQAQLSQTQAEQAAQLSSMQQVVREKDARFETQVRLHEDELLQLVTQADVETEMQQKLRVMQRKLEEHEEALVGRSQVIDLLQQELTAAEQRNQILSQQLQQVEAEHNTLRNTMTTERQEFKIQIEKMELEMAEKKLSFHNLQEEMHHLLKKFEQAGQAQAELESQYSTLEQKHKAEMEAKTSHILSLQKTEQELQSAYDALKDQNSELLKDKNEQAAQSAQAIQQLEDQLQQKSKEINQLLNKPTIQNHEIASQTSFPDQGTQADTEETLASLQKRVVELENEKGALLLSSIELEELKSENEKLSSRIILLEAQNRTGEADREVSEVINITRPNRSSSSTEENEQDVLESTFSQKHKELSVLLLEMKEAQEEIAFLKSQLQGKRAEGEPEVLDQTEMKQTESQGISTIKMKVFLEDRGQDFPSMPNEESNLPAIENKEQENTKHQTRTPEDVSLNDIGMELKSTKQDDVNKSLSAIPDTGQYHQDELERLKSQILELEISFHKAEEIYEKSLDEKAKEINNLTQSLEEFKKNAENTSSTLTALSEERDQLLSQVKELSVVTELRAQVEQLETNLAEAEKQRTLEYESQRTHHNLLTEQIHSLSMEAKSKDVKIEVLQNELDDVQLQFSEQTTLIRSLQSQLQKKESEVLEGAEHLRDISNKMEELLQTLSQKELEIAKMDQLLLEKKRDVETLQQTIEEKDQQVTEISFSMTEKMVQLNEEKFSLGVEIKTLKEQLNLLSRAEEAKKEQVEEDNEVVSELKHNYDELSPAGLISKEELQHELDLLKKESEQRKRKLQAALINRKELLQRVSILEEELAKVKDESRKEIPLSESERREMEADKENKEDSEKCVTSKCQEIEMSLKQTISEKELELEHVRKGLEEKIAAEEELQTIVKQMGQSLQDKTNQIDLLQAEIIENQAIIQKLTSSNKDAGDGDSAAPVKETAAISPLGAGSGEHWKPELEERIVGLEKEKEQLQKKLQEVLTSRKAILKKAQEKERHLKEEIKQQKDDYNRLQEQFDEQSKEKGNIADQLTQLQIQVQESLDKKHPATDPQEPSSPAQGLEQPLLKATEQHPSQPVLESDLYPDWPHPEDTSTLQGNTSIAHIKAQLKEIETEKEQLELKFSSATSELTKKSEEVFLLREQINQQDLEIQSLKTASHEAEARAESLKQKLESSQLEIAGLEHLRVLQPELDELQKLISRKEEEVSNISKQLREKEETLAKVQTEIIEQEDLIKALHTQLEIQAKEHDERIKQFQVELCEMKQKPEEIEEESRAKQQIQRKLQAALISRKEALKENKGLQEELSLARDTIEQLTKSLADMESQVSAQNKEKDTFLGRLALLQEERDKLITEMDKSLLENQNLSGSCESLKLALEGLTEDKENLAKEIESLKSSKIAESTEWQEKHKELQKEYEILLQSYENVSNEAERIQHVVETVRQEKQELYGKLRSAETNKKEIEKQLQEAEQEMEEMKEKMRKFAKSKQQKILELEEENERLRAEVYPAGGTAKECMETLISSNSSMKEELERIKIEYETLSEEFKTLLAEKKSLSEEVQDLQHQREEIASKQASLEAPEKHNQMDVLEEGTQCVPSEVKEQDSLSMSPRPAQSESALSENGAKPDVSEDFSSHDKINNYLQQIDQLNQRIAELEAEKQKDRELSQTLENERNTLLSQVSTKDDKLKMLQDEVTKINLLNQQIQEELSRVTKLKETAEEEKDDLEERLMNQLAELNGSIGNYYQDVTDAQIKNELLQSEMQNLKKCMSELEEEKQQLVKEKTKVESEIRKEYLEKIQGAQKEPGNKSHAKELQELLKEKQQEVKQLQKDCIRYQEKISALERTVKALEFVQTESQKDLEITKEKLAQAVEHRSKAQAELANFKVLLDDTQSEAARVLADNLKLKKELQSNKESIKSQMKQKDEDLERRLEQAEEKHLKEKKNMQEKLDALHREKVQLEETFGEIQLTLNKKDKEVQQLQGNLDSTVAQLAAFTKSMSSLQDDRDRVIDEAKKWERKFGDAIQTKEEEIRLKEENCSVLKDQLKQMSIHMEELKINISRLEHDKQIWESKAQTEVLLQQKVCNTLQGENKELLSQLEETRHLYHNSQNELARLESELKVLRDQSADLNNSLEKCKEQKENLEGIIKQQQADIKNCKFSYEQLETDLQASRELTSRLHEEIHMKEQKIISLLSSKEEAIQVALAELHQQHDKEIKELENLLSQEEEENIVLEEENKKAVDKTNQLMETLKTIKKENIQQKAQLDSFVKSMSSLQNDRDRIVGDYQQLEERHLSVILEKDQLIQEAAAENNKLKEEIRGLRSHMDDLNSENAKLDAELIQYREDLNQVISIKDCQQKQLLEAQLQQNKELKNEYSKLEDKLKESEEAKEHLQKELAQLREQQGLPHRQPDASLSKASFAMNSTEENSFSHLEKLNQQLLSKDEQLLHLSSQLEDSYNQVQSFSKAIASLQNERDRLWNELEKFRKTEEGKQRSAAQPATSPTEVQSLKKAMSSLQNDRDRLLKELKNLQQQYLQINQEINELRPLRAQLQEYQDKTKTFEVMQEELRQENLSWQHELHQLRMEKNSWEMHERRMKEQYLLAISDKDQQLSHLQNLMREMRSSTSQTQPHKVQYQRQASPASLDGSQNLVYETELLRTQLNDSLKEIHQKELRIQQLNGKFSQLLEEKNTLSIQLSDTSQSLRENQQHYSDLLNHCAVLEKQVQELQVVKKEGGPLNVDVAPGAPQEKNGVHRKSDPEELREPQQSFSEAQQQLSNTKQEVSELRKLLEEERDQRVAAENALSVAEEQIRRLEHGEWDSARTPILGSCGSQEQSVLIDITSNSCRRTRTGAGWKRVLRSLCHSRTRVPLLAAIYLLMVHVLLILCFTGHL